MSIIFFGIGIFMLASSLISAFFAHPFEKKVILFQLFVGVLFIILGAKY